MKKKELQKVNKNTRDNFKTYEGYEGNYIAESYIRHTAFDTVIAVSTDLYDLLDAYEDDEDVVYYYVAHDGNAYAPDFG